MGGREAKNQTSETEHTGNKQLLAAGWGPSTGASLTASTQQAPPQAFSPAPASTHTSQTPLSKVTCSQGKALAQGEAGPSQTVLHILCSLLVISTDKRGRLVPLSTSEPGERVTEMALHREGEERAGHTCHGQDDLQGKY